MTEILLTTSAGAIILTMLAIAVQLIIIEPGFIYKVEFLVENKNFTEAETLVKAHIKKHGQDFTANYWLGEIYWQTNRKKDAASIFETLISQKFSHYKNYHHNVLFHLATFYKDKNSPEKALTYIEQLINLESYNPTYYILMGEIFLQSNNPHQALVPLSRAITLDHYNVKVWQLYADINFRIKHFQEAYTAYSHLIKLDPKNPEVWYRLGEICEEIQETAKALRFYLKAEHLSDPQIKIFSALKLGKLYKEQNEIFSAIQALERGLSIANTHVASPEQIMSLHYELAELYVTIQEFDKAITQWEHIMHINKNYLDVKQKLQNFSSIRLSDFFKDLLTKSDNELIKTTCEFVKKFKYVIDDCQTIGSDIITVSASEVTSKWRDTRRSKTLFIFWCSSDLLLENTVLQLLQNQNIGDFSWIIVISAGPVLSEVRNILSRKSIELYDKDNIQNLTQQFS